ncbi:MAG: DUF389 domain-containing protein [Novosphingobium sp.]
MNEPASATGPAGSDWRSRLLHWRERLGTALLIPQLSASEASDLRQRILAGAELDKGYALMCCLSAGIAILGLLQSSTAVVIGAMLVSPLMGPIASLGIAFASIDGERIRQAARTVGVGAAIGITTGMVLTWISPITDATPEILARTQPNLLDLAVALLSGLAGGYATMMAKGETAIGVAIATALMPPLATVGYGLGTMNLGFALGAMLLFLTNLSAIAFSFALIARLSGAARLARNVIWTRRYTAILVVMFLVLAIPLGMTMAQVKRELALRSDVRTAIQQTVGPHQVNIAQLNVKWPIFGDPEVHGVIICNAYTSGFTERLRQQLVASTGSALEIDVQQVVASDAANQTQAVANAAMERGLAAFIADGPPIDDVRSSLGIPVRGLWTDRQRRIVFAEPFDVQGWSIEDYRNLEAGLAEPRGGWSVQVIPPFQANLVIALSGAAATGSELKPATAAWAFSRWGLRKADIAVSGQPDLTEITDQFAKAGVSLNVTASQGRSTGPVGVRVTLPPVGNRQAGQ